MNKAAHDITVARSELAWERQENLKLRGLLARSHACARRIYTRNAKMRKPRRLTRYINLHQCWSVFKKSNEKWRQIQRQDTNEDQLKLQSEEYSLWVENEILKMEKNRII